MCLVMSDAIRYSSSLLNSPGIYYMGPGRFPFQIATDFLFKSVFNDHSPSFNSTAFLHPWKLRMWRVGKVAEDKNNFVAYQVVGGYVVLQPPAWLPHSSAHQPGFEGRHKHIFSRWRQETHFMMQRVFLSQHRVNRPCVLKQTWSWHNLQKSTGGLSTHWHIVCVFIIPNKRTMYVPLSGGQKRERGWIVKKLSSGKIFFLNLTYETYKQTWRLWKNLKMTLKNFHLQT